MPVSIQSIRVGEFFLKGAQLRKVTEIVTDEKNRSRVRYVSKSVNKTNMPFDYTATLANPALMTTFMNACTHHLSPQDVQVLRSKSIILSNE